MAAAILKAKPAHIEHQQLSVERRNASLEHKNYQGFVAGVFSGVAKLSSQCSAVEEIETDLESCHANICCSYSRPPLRHNQSPPANHIRLPIRRPPTMPHVHRPQ